MTDMGKYEILSHVSMSDGSIRIIRMMEQEHVAPHYHENSAQIYTVLEHQIEARVGDRTLLLRPTRRSASRRVKSIASAPPVKAPSS